jgi:hypothetical protein
MITKNLLSMRAALIALAPAIALSFVPAARAQTMPAQQNMAAFPVPTLAAEPSHPILWGSAAAMITRSTLPGSAAHLANLQSAVNGSLSALANSPASIGDDGLAALAKEAGVLYALGLTPPSGAALSSYSAAASIALSNIGTRQSGSFIQGTATPPTINVLQDSPRLQSMAEAYDLIRGSLSSSTDATVRGVIATWANALAGDGNLNTFLGVYPHKDNWGLKGGSALVTAALSLSNDPNANGWMTTGITIVNISIQNVASDAGWFRESAHYLNYTLDDLFSAAVHVNNASANHVDWLTQLKPFAQAALNLRQPDGREAAFEEGVPCVFPFDVFAPYYSDIGGQLAWAWTHSGMDTDAYPNQQPVEATRFLAGELPAAVAPSGAVSRFVGGDAHIAALRSSWDSNAVEATLFAARDFQNEQGAFITSYHDMNNPLDLVVAAKGQLLLPTSGGGPLVTNSANRSSYLLAKSKNVPLVNGGAPWVLDGSKISSDLRLAGSDELGLSGRYLDMARATFAGAYSSPSIAVARTVALVAGQYVAVVDEMDTLPGQSATLGVQLHGRGTRKTVLGTGSPISQSWTYNNEAIDAFSIGSTALTLATAADTYYADSYGAAEETLQRATLNAVGSASHSSVRELTLLIPRDAAANSLVITDRTQANGANGEISGLLAAKVALGDGTVDHLATAPQPYIEEADGGIYLSDAGIAVTNIDGVMTDAVFSSVRENNGALISFGAARATSLSFNGTPILVSGTPVTVSFGTAPSIDGGTGAAGFVGAISQDNPGVTSIQIHNLAGFDPGAPYSATLNGAAITQPNFFQLADGFQLGGITGGGTVTVVQSGPELLGLIPAQAVAEGQPLTFTVLATPPAGQTVAFSYSSLTTFALHTAPVLNPLTGVFTWTPDYDIASAAGPTDVVIDITATTGALTVTRAVHITVTDVDRGPTLAPVPTAYVRRQSNYSLQLVATDPDGYPITYSWQAVHTFPSPAPSFDATRGTFTWNCPLSAPIGDNELIFTASDGHVSATQTMHLIVQDVNHVPVFVAINGVALDNPTTQTMSYSIGSTISLVIQATDADADALTYTARQARGDLPDGATFVPSTQTFTWTPTALGSTTIIVHVDDGHGGAADLQLTINVTGSSGGCASAGGSTSGFLALLLGALLLERSRRRLQRA